MARSGGLSPDSFINPSLPLYLMAPSIGLQDRSCHTERVVRLDQRNRIRYEPEICPDQTRICNNHIGLVPKGGEPFGIQQ